MSKFGERFKDSLIRFAEGPHSTVWLSFFSFVEASVFPIPPDVLLIAILTTKESRRWLFYSFVTSVSSVLGGVLGYIIGYAFFGLVGEKMIAFYGLEDHFIKIGELFGRSAFLTVFVSGFTPIPYKVFTIASGFFEINFLVFVLASLFGRSARFFLVGFLMHLFGKKVGNHIYRKMNLFSLILGLLVLGIVFIFVL